MNHRSLNIKVRRKHALGEHTKRPLYDTGVCALLLIAAFCGLWFGCAEGGTEMRWIASVAGTFSLCALFALLSSWHLLARDSQGLMERSPW